MKLAHRGIRVWISNNDNELPIWKWRASRKVQAHWDKTVRADLVSGYIAVEESQVRVVVACGLKFAPVLLILPLPSR